MIIQDPFKNCLSNFQGLQKINIVYFLGRPQHDSDYGVDVDVYENLGVRDKRVGAQLIRVPDVANIYVEYRHMRPRTRFNSNRDMVLQERKVGLNELLDVGKRKQTRESSHDENEYKKKYLKYKQKYLQLKKSLGL